MHATPPSLRPGGRSPGQLRPLTLTPGFVQTAEGSVLVSLGNTRVLTNATIEQGVPGWLRNSGRGWVTAEYSMLPRSTVTRTPRESERGKIGGRTHEIQRLIGRSLRSVVDMQALGERTVILDCDVIQADGGTRTAAITGAAVALALALDALVKAGTLKTSPLKQLVAATSVGIVDGAALLDLCYEEDAQAEVDMNVVMTADGGLVETQATAEKGSYSRADLNGLIDLAEAGTQGDLRGATEQCSRAGNRDQGSAKGEERKEREQKPTACESSASHAARPEIACVAAAPQMNLVLQSSFACAFCSGEGMISHAQKRNIPPIATLPCANICSNCLRAATRTPLSTPPSKTFPLPCAASGPKAQSTRLGKCSSTCASRNGTFWTFRAIPTISTFPGPKGYWPAKPVPPDAKAWDKSVRAFRRDLKAMSDLVADPATDLYAKIPHGNGQTILREALLVADHNAYHLGELVLLRRLLGAW